MWLGLLEHHSPPVARRMTPVPFRPRPVPSIAVEPVNTTLDYNACNLVLVVPHFAVKANNRFDRDISPLLGAADSHSAGTVQRWTAVSSAECPAVDAKDSTVIADGRMAHKTQAGGPSNRLDLSHSILPAPLVETRCYAELVHGAGERA